MEEIDLYFDSKWNKLAVSVSGGADSCLLAYMLCEEITKFGCNTEIHIISNIRCWKTRPWQKYDSLRIYHELVNRFPSVTFFRHTNFIAPDLEYGANGPVIVDEYNKKVSGDNAQIRGFAEYICYNYDIDAHYNAVTRNPRNVNFCGMTERDVEPNENNKHLQVMKHLGKMAIHPFRFLEKDVIIKKYIELGIEDLLEKTRSCEGEFEDLDYTTYKPNMIVPTCGECFWCMEREWAIEKAR